MSQDKLNEIFRLHREYQGAMGYDLDIMTVKERIDYILTMSYALSDEIHESTKEVGWKPWATSKHINQDAYRSELIDAFCFLLNLMLAAGMSPLTVWRGYKAKLKKNYDRIKNGYDGVSSKCPVCKRDFDDAGVECSPGVHVEDHYPLVGPVVQVEKQGKGKHRAARARV